MAKTQSSKMNPTDHDHSGHTHHVHDSKGHPEIGGDQEINFTIPWASISAQYQVVLKKYQPHVKTDGFRQGKAPLNMVEQRVGTERIYQDVLERLLPKAYIDAVNKAGKKPIADPEIHPSKMDRDADWEFHAHIAEKPEVNLGKYGESIKKAAKEFEKNYKPEPVDKKKEAPEIPKEELEQQKKDQKLQAILSALRESIKPIIPELLIRQEITHQMRQMEEQLKVYNMNMDSYLASVNKKIEDVQTDFAGRALANWQLELIIDAIALDRKLEVTDKDIETELRTVKQEFKTLSADRVAQYRSMMKKQKVFEWMLSL